ncbi:hypothetical protein PtB15_12B191 [Puccinia triticina]|nr:hypothetical protein PtB15_12B191 [Puccinia triticina]
MSKHQSNRFQPAARASSGEQASHADPHPPASPASSDLTVLSEKCPSPRTGMTHLSDIMESGVTSNHRSLLTAAGKRKAKSSATHSQPPQKVPRLSQNCDQLTDVAEGSNARRSTSTAAGKRKAENLPRLRQNHARVTNVAEQLDERLDAWEKQLLALRAHIVNQQFPTSNARGFTPHGGTSEPISSLGKQITAGGRSSEVQLCPYKANVLKYVSSSDWLLRNVVALNYDDNPRAIVLLKLSQELNLNQFSGVTSTIFKYSDALGGFNPYERQLFLLGPQIGPSTYEDTLFRLKSLERTLVQDFISRMGPTSLLDAQDFQTRVNQIITTNTEYQRLQSDLLTMRTLRSRGQAILRVTQTPAGSALCYPIDVKEAHQSLSIPVTQLGSIPANGQALSDLSSDFSDLSSHSTERPAVREGSLMIDATLDGSEAQYVNATANETQPSHHSPSATDFGLQVPPPVPSSPLWTPTSPLWPPFNMSLPDSVHSTPSPPSRPVNPASPAQPDASPLDTNVDRTLDNANLRAPAITEFPPSIRFGQSASAPPAAQSSPASSLISDIITSVLAGQPKRRASDGSEHPLHKRIKH